MNSEDNFTFCAYCGKTLIKLGTPSSDCLRSYNDVNGNKCIYYSLLLTNW